VAGERAGGLVPISTATGAKAGTPLTVPVTPARFAVTRAAMWLVPGPRRASASIVRVDRASGRVSGFQVQGVPFDVVARGDTVWVALRQPNQIVRLCGA
jgi:hypothetical protein